MKIKSNLSRTKYPLLMVLMAGLILIFAVGCQKSAGTETSQTATITLEVTQVKPTQTASTPKIAYGTPTNTLPPDLSGLISGTPLPDWNGIPLMADAQAGSENGDNYLYKTASLPADVIAFYNQQLPKLGWTARPENETPDASGIITLAYEKDKLLVLVGVIPQADGTMVMLGNQVKP